MIIGHAPSELAPARIDVAAGTAFELLVALAGASVRAPGDVEPALADALDAVGDGAGESWLNLLGIPIDLGPPHEAATLVGAVEQMDPVELRRHLLGAYAWSWSTLGGADTIEAAAAGDRTATRKLLGHERYYAGRARDSLSVLLPLDPAETRDRLWHALDVGGRLLLDAPADGLQAAAAEATTTLDSAPLEDAIEQVTGGYRYAPEVEAERVLLIPHLRPAPSLVLAQHRGSRLIVYRARARGDGDVAERVAALGRALSDPKRVEILKLLARGVDRVSRLVAETGLTRSTVHHHLSQLRESRLVDLEGNARAYRYVLREDALPEISRLLAELLEPGS